MLAAFYHAIHQANNLHKKHCAIIWVYIKHSRIPNFSLCIFCYNNPQTNTHTTQFRSFIRPSSTGHDYETCRV